MTPGEAAAFDALLAGLLRVAAPVPSPGLADDAARAVAACESYLLAARQVPTANSLDRALRLSLEAAMAAEAAAAELGAVLARLHSLRDAAAAAAKDTRAALGVVMLDTGCPEICTGQHAAVPAVSAGRVAIDDPAALPAHLWRQPEPVPDRAGILALLRSGRPVPGAHLEPGQPGIRIIRRNGT